MANIRPFEQEDLPAVAALLRANLALPLSEQEISRRVHRAMLDDPWREEELPSLVATGPHGEVVGFLGVQVRRFRFDGRIVRGVCTSHLAVDPEHRRSATGVLMLQRALTAGQDFSFSDSANRDVVRIWGCLGGYVDPARAYDWIATLRPIRWVRTLGAAAAMPGRRPQIPVRGFPLRPITPSFRHEGSRTDPELSAQDVDPATIAKHLPAMTRTFRFSAEYDEQTLNHTLGSVAREYGSVVLRLVRRAAQPLGWYAYVAQPRGVRRVIHLHLTAWEADPVLDDLVNHARVHGGVILVGRSEPHLVAALLGKRLVFGLAGKAVLHSHQPELMSVLATGSSLRTHLDGEWFEL